LIDPADRVLDLGSGKAPYKSMFVHRQYVTADLFAKADVRCDATALPFADQAFDLAICTEVLEHVPEPAVTLGELNRLLSDGGTLVLTTPLTWGVHETFDFHRWTDTGLQRLLTRGGFEVETVRPRGGVLLCLGALLLIVPWQLFGAAAGRRWWRTLLFALTYPMLLVPATVLAVLDPLDRQQKFTQGYVALCRKKQDLLPAGDGLTV